MRYSRVLVILKGYLGDAVMVTPLLHGLSREANLKVDVLTEPPVIQLLEDTFPEICFHRSERLGSLGGMARQVREVRSWHCDLAISVNRSFRSALLPALAGIPTRAGHSTDRRKWLLTKAMPYDLQRFEPESYIDLAKLAGIEIASIHPRLTPKTDLISEICTKLAGAQVGLQPGARHPWKEIPVETLAPVARHLQAEGHKLVLLGGPEERQQGETLQSKLSEPAINLIGTLSLKETLAAVCQLRLMIGGDTGLMHIAAAAGCPTATGFGPTVANKWGHRYPPHQVLVAAGRTMAELGPEQYLDAAHRILDKK